MATTARQSKGARKGPPEPNSARRTQAAWSNPRPSPTYSSAATPPRPAATAAPVVQATFPPLAQTNGAPRPDNSRDRVLQALSGLTGTTITLTTKTNQRYEGVVDSTNSEGDTTGIILKNVKDVANLAAPPKPSLFIASTNIDSYTSGPADAKITNGDSFRTDADISQKKGAGRERELQAWVPNADTSGAAHAPGGDDETFGATNGSWDQFSVNEQLFGVKASFDEDVYTTKLDRSAPDFKEKEKRAQRIAAEIMGAVTNNPHIAEERGLAVDDSGVNEEDKYGAVVRGQNAYVPPGARRPGAPAPAAEVPKLSVNGPDGSTVQAQAQSPPSSKAASPAPAVAGPSNASANKPPADPLPAFRDFVTHEKQRLTQKRQALVKNEMDKRMAELVKFSQSFKLNKPIPEDLVPILAKDSEKQRTIKEKAERDAQSTGARAIGPSTPATASRGAVPAKVPDSARKPSIVQAASSKNVTSSAQSPVTAAITPKPSAVSSQAPTPIPAKNLDGTASKKVSMVIQTIPPFRGAKRTAATPPNGNGLASAPNLDINSNAASSSSSSKDTGPISPSTANRLNVNASSFRPNPKANAFAPATPTSTTSPVKTNASNAASASVSPKPKQEAPSPPNPFFGTRPIKKSTPVHVKDDFNPFKHNKVVDASQISAIWPYSGKRYMQMYPSPPHPQNQHPPHMVPPMAPPMPPPSYEEDSAAQAAAQRGYVYAYPPYGYPPQHMMPGMGPPAPPAGYMPGPYMQHMPYPPGMPPPGVYSPAMGQMPPPGAYLPPPPGAYPPPPNGAGGPRPSMPPTPIPAHAHAYYHQSPQLQHAYPIMMPPPQSMQPHGNGGGGYPPEGAPAPPVQMGGH